MLKSRALPQLGTDLDRGSSTPQKGRDFGDGGGKPKDFFQERDGQRFAGTHLIIDLWEAARLTELDHIDATLQRCAEAAGATLLHLELHHFTPNGGVSGVAVLAESHISIHTWPEHAYAALDVFMCGDTEPRAAIPILEQAFSAGRVEVQELRRGQLEA